MSLICFNSLGRPVDTAILTQQANELAEIELALAKINDEFMGYVKCVRRR